MERRKNSNEILVSPSFCSHTRSLDKLSIIYGNEMEKILLEVENKNYNSLPKLTQRLIEDTQNLEIQIIINSAGVL